MKENQGRERRQDLTCSEFAQSPSSQFSYKSMLDYSVLYTCLLSFFKGIICVSSSGPQSSWHQGLVLGRTIFPPQNHGRFWDGGNGMGVMAWVVAWDGGNGLDSNASDKD